MVWNSSLDIQNPLMSQEPTSTDMKFKYTIWAVWFVLGCVVSPLVPRDDPKDPPPTTVPHFTSIPDVGDIQYEVFEHHTADGQKVKLSIGTTGIVVRKGVATILKPGHTVATSTVGYVRMKFILTESNETSNLFIEHPIAGQLVTSGSKVVSITGSGDNKEELEQAASLILAHCNK